MNDTESYNDTELDAILIISRNEINCLVVCEIWAFELCECIIEIVLITEKVERNKLL